LNIKTKKSDKQKSVGKRGGFNGCDGRTKGLS